MKLTRENADVNNNNNNWPVEKQFTDTVLQCSVAPSARAYDGLLGCARKHACMSMRKAWIFVLNRREETKTSCLCAEHGRKGKSGKKKPKQREKKGICLLSFSHGFDVVYLSLHALEKNICTS